MALLLLQLIWTRVFTILNLDITVAPSIGVAPTITQAWMFRRCLAACSRGSWRRCGGHSGGPRLSRSWRPVPQLGRWPGIFWILLKKKCPSFIRRCNISRWKFRARDGNSLEPRSPVTSQLDGLPLALKFPLLIAVVFFRMSWWTRYRCTAWL